MAEQEMLLDTATIKAAVAGEKWAKQEELPKLLWRIYSKSNKNVTTYKKLELALKAEKRML